MNLTTQFLVNQLNAVADFGSESTVQIAYSGGIDSTVLLHLVNRLRESIEFNLIALHFNHRINPESDAWQQSCARYCESSGIEFHSASLERVYYDSQISEGKARTSRYAWFETQLGKGDILLTAHHQDDQVETFVLNLMRGAGVRGLAAIQPLRDFASGWLLRPLLSISRAEIVEYARTWELAFIEDPANSNLGHDRNYLRHVVLPALSERWPSADQQIGKAALHLSQSRRLIDALAKLDVQACQTEGQGFLSVGVQLCGSAVKSLDRARQINLIRYWTRKYIQSEPGRLALDKFLDTAILGDKDFAEMCWSNHCIYLYQNVLYLTQAVSLPDSPQPVSWDLRKPLTLEEAGLVLVPKFQKNSGLSADKLGDKVTVQYRTGSERIILPGRKHSSSLKKLFQQHLIPPWERNLLPLIYSQDELAAVVPWVVSERFKAAQNETGILISLKRV